MISSVRLRACAVFRLEGGIDLQQRGSLTLGKSSVRSYRCGDDFVPGAITQESGLYVKCFGGNAETLGNSIEDFSTGLAQSAFNLAQIRIRDFGGFCKLAKGHLCLIALISDKRSESTDIYFCHAHSMHPSACKSKR